MMNNASRFCGGAAGEPGGEEGGGREHIMLYQERVKRALHEFSWMSAHKVFESVPYGDMLTLEKWVGRACHKLNRITAVRVEERKLSLAGGGGDLLSSTGSLASVVPVGAGAAGNAGAGAAEEEDGGELVPVITGLAAVARQRVLDALLITIIMIGKSDVKVSLILHEMRTTPPLFTGTSRKI